ISDGGNYIRNSFVGYNTGGKIMAKLTEAQKKANKKWDDENKELKRIYRYRSYSRKFIKEMANENDLNELQMLLDTRRKDLD
ncbi:hypothetical protein, partial [Lactiplantibacillus plantarum]|uniref:hypothetical protein n=2 Tax=Lactiplantibacillus plantarum TaxID=1590 RepID=UPI003965AA08